MTLRYHRDAETSRSSSMCCSVASTYWILFLTFHAIGYYSFHPYVSSLTTISPSVLARSRSENRLFLGHLIVEEIHEFLQC